jgi:hypothetical protein
MEKGDHSLREEILKRKDQNKLFTEKEILDIIA